MDTLAASTAPPTLSDWVLTPAVTTVMVLATAAYFAGTVRARRAGSGWPVLRSVSWLVSMALLVFALNSPMRILADHLFWAHMVVHLVLITVVPVFGVLSQPIRLAAAATGESGDRRIRAVLANRVVRLFTGPVLGLPIYAAVLIGTHLTGFQGLALREPWAQHLEYALYVFSGWLLMMPLIGDELCGPTRLGSPLRFATFLVSMGPDTLVGVTLMMSSYEIAPGYSASRSGWGPTVLQDQNLAGGIMWFGGDGLMMLLLLIVAWQWIRREGIGAGSEHGASMGSWLDSARRSSLIGDTTASDGDGSPSGADAPGADVDDDEAALAAYNARLAALNRRYR
jgi:putative membrane protein